MGHLLGVYRRHDKKGNTFDEALANLGTVFERLKAAGLKLKYRKCKLFKKEVVFLGHTITSKGICTEAEKVKSVQQWPAPVTVTDVRSFRGLCGYYRKCIQKFAEIARPLHRLIEKGCDFKWTTECEEALTELKFRLTVLSQVQDGKEWLVAYAGRVLTKAERRHCMTRREVLAVITFVKHFCHYLYGQAFVIRTDQSALRWFYNFKDPEGHLERQIQVLSSNITLKSSTDPESNINEWNDGNRTVHQAIVPWSERRNVLQMYHEAKVSGHLGIKKTLSKTRQTLYWPGLQRDVRQYVMVCHYFMERKSQETLRRRLCKLKDQDFRWRELRSTLWDR